MPRYVWPLSRLWLNQAARFKREDTSERRRQQQEPPLHIQDTVVFPTAGKKTKPPTAAHTRRALFNTRASAPQGQIFTLVRNSPSERVCFFHSRNRPPAG